MFVLKQSDSYSWPVSVRFPVSGGSHQEQKFDGEFIRVTQSRIREIQKQIADEEITDFDLAKSVLIGWKGVQDESGNDLPFSIEHRDRLLEVALVAGSVVAAFFESITGAKRKN